MNTMSDLSDNFRKLASVALNISNDVAQMGFGTPAVMQPDLGPLASFNGRVLFPADHAWNQRADSMTVDSRSDAIIHRLNTVNPTVPDVSLHADFGATPAEGGIPYIIVDSRSEPWLSVVSILYADESEGGAIPAPLNTPIEQSGDAHLLAYDRAGRKIYELFNTKVVGNAWACDALAVFDEATGAPRPMGWTSADAAGLPMLPGLVRYDEVAAGAINHALRFTFRSTFLGFVPPARHAASNAPDKNTATDLPPMGARFRLKKSFDISGYPTTAKVILQAIKTYGMILADNGASMYISGTQDSRWNNAELATLGTVGASQFEVMAYGQPTLS
jgi:hypothetical protein